jgi:non-canonical poly(A) RNA polymerase PAPD5/7
MEPPPSIDLSRMSDSYRPPSQRPGQIDRRSDNGNRNGAGQNGEHYQPVRNRQGPGRAQGRFPSKKAAERPFLRTNRSPTPDLMPGMGEEEGIGVKFRAIEDMSDSDEAEMDLSSDDDQEQFDGGQPKKKQARTEFNASNDGEAVPKWSNPDPYTALPPIDELQRKKLDVVKLIRKARVVSASDTVTKADAVTDDFISFDFDDEVKDYEKFPETLDKDAGQGMPGAPTGPRAQSSHQGSFNDLISSQPVDRKTTRNTIQMKLESSSDPALGSRKRTIDDEIKGETPISKRLRPKQSKGGNGDILPKWRIDPKLSPHPWCTVDHAATANMGYW